jgi:hypothetical protein
MYTLNKVLAVVFVLLIAGVAKTMAQQDSSSKKWDILPDKHIVPLFTADGRAHRLSLIKPFNDNGYIGSMGGIFPLVAFTKNKHTLQFSAASTVYTTLRKWTDRGRLINVDFFVDFFLDLKLNEQWALRGGIGHTSQHLTDDAIQDLGLVPIQYTRDYGQLFGVYTNTKYRLLCYGGWIFNGNLKTTINMGAVSMFQLGFEHAPIKWFDHNYIYYAADLKFRGESDYRTIHSAQLGYKYAHAGKHTFRFAAGYTGGMDERGQFYKQRRDFGTLGMYFDF